MAIINTTINATNGGSSTAEDISYNSSTQYSSGTVGKELKEHSEKIVNIVIDVSSIWDSEHNYSSVINTGAKWYDGRDIYRVYFKNILQSNEFARLDIPVVSVDVIVGGNSAIIKANGECFLYTGTGSTNNITHIFDKTDSATIHAVSRCDTVGGSGAYAYGYVEFVKPTT